MILTMSPFFSWTERELYLALSSFDRWALTSAPLLCNGRFAAYFRCFRGCMLAFQLFDHSFFIVSLQASYDYARNFGNCRPSVARFFRDRPFEYCPFRVSFLILEHDHRIILEFYPHSVRPSVFFFLADYDRENHFLSHLCGAFLDCDHDKVSDSGLRMPSFDWLVPEDRHDLDQFRSRVITCGDDAVMR